jgi:predicted phage baseplate assembly protein
LTWSYSTAKGSSPFAAGAVTDGTNGLRRSGIVRVKVPADWSAVPGPPAGLALILSSAPRPYPPRVARLIPNVVTISNKYPYHSSKFPSDQADISKQVRRWMRRPGNVLVLPEDARPPIAETVVVSMTERDGSHDWTPVADLAPYGPDGRYFVVDAAGGRLRFGDGLNGRLPIPVGADPITVSCTVGGGNAGNLGSNLAWRFDQIDGVEGSNVVPAEGGRDAETLADARDRAASELRQPGRAVTQADFEAIARATPGAAIARAHAAVGRHPMYPGRDPKDPGPIVPGAVTIFIVPDLPRKPDGSPDPGLDTVLAPGPSPDAAVLEAVQQNLDRARLITSEVYVRPPKYRPVALAVTVSSQASDTQALRSRVTSALAAYLDPLIGGDDGNGWPFGGSLRPSSLLHVVQDAVGDAGAAELVAIRLEDIAMAAEKCNDVPIGADNLVVLTGVDITLRRPPAGRGGLR